MPLPFKLTQKSYNDDLVGQGAESSPLSTVPALPVPIPMVVQQAQLILCQGICQPSLAKSNKIGSATGSKPSNCANMFSHRALQQLIMESI
jgi:hypothetical protein